MLDNFFNKVTCYILKKTYLERVLLLSLFCMCIFVIASYIKYERIEHVNLRLDSNDGLKSVQDLAKKYQIFTKCLRLLCDVEEFGNKVNSVSVNTNEFLDSKIYYLYFSCESLNCYEFIREVENIPLAFIREISGFNVDITHINDNEDMQNLDSSEYVESKDSKKLLLNSMLNMDDEQEIQNSEKYVESKHLPFEWKQNIKMVLEIKNLKHDLKHDEQI